MLGESECRNCDSDRGPCTASMVEYRNGDGCDIFRRISDPHRIARLTNLPKQFEELRPRSGGLRSGLWNTRPRIQQPQSFNWQSGDLAIADAAYATAQQLSCVKENGAEYIVRCAAANIRLFSQEGERIHVADELSKQEGRSVVSIQVQIKSGIDMQTAYLHALRLPHKIDSQ